MAVFIGAVAAALLVGFLAGLWSFKVKSRWCPRHGCQLVCPDCHRAGAHWLVPR
jgi:hypothetical protein